MHVSGEDFPSIKGDIGKALVLVMAATMRGTVNRVLLDQQCGFIRRDDGQADVMFTIQSLDPALPFTAELSGRRVEFEVINGARGPFATNVKEGRRDMA